MQGATASMIGIAWTMQCGICLDCMDSFRGRYQYGTRVLPSTLIHLGSLTEWTRTLDATSPSPP
jgi:hypothetical protein